ncbi:MAG: M23 family metallopeptidase [Candidatus Obscuribacterales bacterium]
MFGLLFGALEWIVWTVASHYHDLEDNNAVRLVEVRKGGQVLLYAFSSRFTEATVHGVVNGKNISVFPSKRLSRGLSKNMQDPFFVIQRLDPKKRMEYHYRKTFHRGVKGGKPDLAYVYQLPFRAGLTSRVTGAYGTRTHMHKNKIEYAIDFSMPVDSIVSAARSGTVIAVRANSDTGGREEFYQKAANYIIIKHDDGTYAEYYHLKKDGAFVKPNDKVEAEDFIGLSGLTGWTSGPHLHFSVFYYDDNGKLQTVPVLLNTSRGIYENPKVGDRLTKAPPPKTF